MFHSKRVLVLIFSILLWTFSGCGAEAAPSASVTIPPAEAIVQTITEPIPTTEPAPTQPEHSPLYLPDVAVEDVIRYFNEVCLDSEFMNGGDPSFVQKWTASIHYTLEGEYTEEDLRVLESFENFLNSIEGFPGIQASEDPSGANLRIVFCTQEEILEIMGQDFINTDGAVTFWYYEDEIYDAIICYRTDVDQQIRNSVILEEIYNGLGPVQDTDLREDSIIYSGFSQPQWLTAMDELLLKLLYHPDILPGMDAAECEQIIRQLYY